jgi:ubiquinone/menaquinone biosynthesis C-methylase UbiE/uncharacterized protein YbaR (Trm112 family)
MDRRLLYLILCPVCSTPLELSEATCATIEYAAGSREEVQSGTVACSQGHAYPISDFVLSFESLYPPDLQREAAYWDRYYTWLLEQGSYGFHDLRLGLAPYITQGVPEPFPAADTIDRYDVHHKVAEHPLLRKGRTLLDIGVGLGWTSLHFARSGYEVTAFEPSPGPARAAKRYAMEQGVFIEYICAALGSIAFRPSSFDNVTAFHSLHHDPDLETNLRAVRGWLRPGGGFAVDEHVGNSRLAGALAAELHQWAEAEVFPSYRTLPPEALAALPQEPHSALEDSSVSRVAPLVRSLFSVQMEQSRHVFLDHYPLLYYLHAGRDLDAYRHALAIANQMQELVRRVDSEGGDYLTMVAENIGGKAAPESEPPLASHEEVPPAEMPAPPSPEPAPARPDLRERVVQLESQLREQAAWAQGLESELERKNAALTRMEEQLRQREAELGAARAPRLPWKRRK